MRLPFFVVKISRIAREMIICRFSTAAAAVAATAMIKPRPVKPRPVNSCSDPSRLALVLEQDQNIDTLGGIGMLSNTAEKPPSIIPYLYYEDVAGALVWLARTFGFREREKETMRSPEGRVVHAAMELGAGVVMMGCPDSNYKSPKRIGHVTQNLYVYVDDVDQHFEHAKRAGATILAGIEDTFYGDRRYGVEDLEGHHWYFAQKVHEMAPQEWKPSQEDLKGHG